MENENRLDKLATSYLVNADTFTELKYMIKDFMDDTMSLKMPNGVKMECESRVEEINYLIESLELTMRKSVPKFSKYENDPFCDYDKAVQKEFNTAREADFMAILREYKGDVIEANHEFIRQIKHYIERQKNR